MVDIGLDDSVRLGMMPEDIDPEDMVRSLEDDRAFEGHRLLPDEDDDQGPPDDIAIEMPPDDDPPAFQQFRRTPPQVSNNLPFASPTKADNFMPRLSSPHHHQRGPHMSIVWEPFILFLFLSPTE